MNNDLNNQNGNLPSSGKGLVYEVPEGYFEGLAASIMAKLKTAEAPSAAEEVAALSAVVAGISRKTPFSLPPAYFENNLNDWPVLVRPDRESAILMLVEGTTPYTVPYGYFEELPSKILHKVAAKKGRIVPLRQRKWVRTLAAAVIGGLVATSGYLYFAQEKAPAHNPPVAAQLKNVSTKELDDFLKATDVHTATYATAQVKTADAREVKELLKDVPTREIDRFLDQLPVDDDLYVIN